jgi:hypothetical protein
MSRHQADAGVAVMLSQDDQEGSNLQISIRIPDREDQVEEHYPAVFVNMDVRAVSFALDRLRRTIIASTN